MHSYKVKIFPSFKSDMLFFSQAECETLGPFYYYFFNIWLKIQNW
jgi:hypothetical protein